MESDRSNRGHTKLHQALIGPRVHCCFIFNTLFSNFPMERADAFKTPTMPRARRVSGCVFSCTLVSAGIQQCLHLLTSKLTPSCGHHPDSLITSRSLHGSVGRNGAAACCQHISSTNIVPVLLWRDGWQEKAQVLQVSPVATGLIGIYLHLGC